MVTIHAISGRTITLGREGENLARQVVFDVSEWRSSYGDGTVSLIAQRHRDTEPYPCNITVDGDTITWPITAADTAHPDYGRCELRYTVGDVLVKSETWRTYTADSLGTPLPEPPEPQKAWVDKVLKAGQAAVDASVNPPKIGENGNWHVWDFDAGMYVDTGVAASGGGGGGVTDVHVEGESVVADGVANIPIATATRAGLVAVNAGYGFRIAGGKYLGFYAANEQELSNRVAVSKPIVPTNYDYAVKVAMCDGKGPAWTSDEQAVALKRLGVSKSILDFTYDGEDVDTLSVQIQDIQDFFRARMLICKCSIFLDAPSTSWATVRVMSYQNDTVVSNSFQISYNSVPSADANTEIMARSVHFRTDEIINYLTIGKRWGKNIGLNSPALDMWSSYNKLSNADVTNKLAVLFPSIDGGAKYKAGTSISIVGVM